MKYRWDREYEVRVPCDVHGTVWAVVTRRYPDGSPEACACPECVRLVFDQMLAADPSIKPDEYAGLRDEALGIVTEMTLTMTPRAGQVRERDVLAAAEEGLAQGGGSGSVMANRPTYQGSDDDGE